MSASAAAGRDHTSPRRLTVISANLLNPFFRIGRIDGAATRRRMEAFARLVEQEEGDVLLCQEVGRSREFRVDEWLAKRLAMTAVYHRANGSAERYGREEGIAVLSRCPLLNPVSCLLGDGLWRRPALGVTAATPLGQITLFSVHMSLRPWRNRRQSGRLAKWVEEMAADGPALIGGDFNATPDAPHMAKLNRRWLDAFRAAGDGPATAYTYEAKVFGRVLSQRRIDYLFLKPGLEKLRVVSCSHIGNPPAFSDHLAVVGRFERIAP